MAWIRWTGIALALAVVIAAGLSLYGAARWKRAAQDRGRTLKGAVVATPWEGRWSDYRRHAGMLVPFTGEVAWLVPGGRHPYWRGTITALTYEFAN